MWFKFLLELNIRVTWGNEKSGSKKFLWRLKLGRLRRAIEDQENYTSELSNYSWNGEKGKKFNLKLRRQENMKKNQKSKFSSEIQ